MEQQRSRAGVALTLALVALAAIAAALFLGRSTAVAAGTTQGPKPPQAGQTGKDGKAEGPDGQAFAKFKSCMQAHGATPPQPGQRPSGPPDAKTKAALQACRQYLPPRPQGGPRGAMGMKGPGGEACPGKQDGKQDGRPSMTQGQSQGQSQGQQQEGGQQGQGAPAPSGQGG